MATKQQLEHARATLAELTRRSGAALLDGLFPQQRAFIQSKAKMRAALCTRRAGKTYGVGTWLILTALAHPYSNCLYLGMTRRQAKKNMWPVLKLLSRKYGLELETNEQDLEIRCSNGSVIMLVGCDDSRSVDKLRGSHYKLVVIDEAASFGKILEPLIRDVIDPALLDDDGDLAMIGTPGAACVGLFHDITNVDPKGWEIHRWNVLDNTFLPRAKMWLEERKQKFGWTDDDPTYVREWLGRWVRDDKGLVYRYSADRNMVEELPELESHILGVDLGFDDATALSVVSFSARSPNAYIHDSFSESGCTISDVAAKIIEYTRQYSFDRIVVDQGGLGKMVVAELSTRFELPLFAAEKSNKVGFIKLLNSDLQAGRLKVLKADKWIEEASVLPWDAAGRKEDGRFANHVNDAALYAFRESRHWLTPIHALQATAPLTGSDMERRIEESIIRRLTQPNDDDLSGIIDQL